MEGKERRDRRYDRVTEGTRELCAADVDFPVDLLVYRRGSFSLIEHRYHRNDLSQISNWWQDRMRCAVAELPSKWIESAFSELTSPEGSSYPPDT